MGLLCPSRGPQDLGTILLTRLGVSCGLDFRHSCSDRVATVMEKSGTFWNFGTFCIFWKSHGIFTQIGKGQVKKSPGPYFRKVIEFCCKNFVATLGDEVSFFFSNTKSLYRQNVRQDQRVGNFVKPALRVPTL